MRLRTPLLSSVHDGSADHGHTLFVAEAASVESEAPAYVWPLNPWGGYPFRRASA